MTRVAPLVLASDCLYIINKLKMSTASFEKCQSALRLYRSIMKLHIRNMPNDLRLFGILFFLTQTLGDLYVKQEFRLHLDKASDDQMDKFLTGWQGYVKQIEKMD